MKKKFLSLLMVGVISATVLTGCGQSAEVSNTDETQEAGEADETQEASEADETQETSEADETEQAVVEEQEVEEAEFYLENAVPYVALTSHSFAECTSANSLWYCGNYIEHTVNGNEEVWTGGDYPSGIFYILNEYQEDYNATSMDFAYVDEIISKEYDAAKAEVNCSSYIIYNNIADCTMSYKTYDENSGGINFTIFNADTGAYDAYQYDTADDIIISANQVGSIYVECFDSNVSTEDIKSAIQGALNTVTYGEYYTVLASSLGDAVIDALLNLSPRFNIKWENVSYSYADSVYEKDGMTAYSVDGKEVIPSSYKNLHFIVNEVDYNYLLTAYYNGIVS